MLVSTARRGAARIRGDRVQAMHEDRHRLAPGGLAAITRWVRLPPRDGLKLFATAVAEAAAPGARVWVHDYQLLLLPRMLREALPEARIGFFLHIPFPAPEIFCALPWRDELIQGLLASDTLLGVLAHVVVVQARREPFHVHRQHVGDGLDAAVGMPGKAGEVVLGSFVTEVVQQQERIQAGHLRMAEDAVQADAGALDGGLSGQ